VRSPRSPAAAFAWEFRHRHRWGLIALTGYLLVLGTIKLLILESGHRVHFASEESFAFLVIVPLTATFTYLLAVFSFGLSGDLGARQSTYPARMFTLPVSTAALAGWPMLYGTAAVAIFWFAARLFVAWPPGVDVPLVWPALLAASLLAWTQALTWMPYGLPGLRVIVAVLWLAAIDSLVLLAVHFNTREPVMLAILAPHVPLAYLAARFAVARARRGDLPDWRGRFTPLGIAAARSSRRDRFASPARAQVWFEWRRHGRSLPALVGILLPFELALLFVAGDTPKLVFVILLGVLLTPPFMASFVAATVAKSNPYGSDSYGLTPFIATRPMNNAQLVAAKLKATIWSTLAAWLLVLVAIPLALHLSGNGPMVIDRFRRFERIGALRVTVMLLLGFAGLLASTWKQLVQSLFIGLTGRERVVKARVFLTLALLAALGPIVEWIIDSRTVQAALWKGFPLILGVLVCCKTVVAAWIATRLYRGRVLSDRTLVIGAACWLGAVLALYGLLVWLFSMPPFIPSYLLGLIAILTIPLARVSAAPLALAGNRHR
jgi:hypothetical protein